MTDQTSGTARRRLRRIVAVGFMACALATLAPAPAFLAQSGEEQLLETGNRLAAVLRAGRSVVSANQELINDASMGDKGLTPDIFLEKVAAVYEEAIGEPMLTDGLTDLQRELTEAQLEAMRQVVEEAQPLINQEGMGFKGFIPAVFARLTNERFGEMVGTTAHVKVTAPLHLVRNRKAQPDDWEIAAIEEKLDTPDWEKGAPFFEVLSADSGGKFRMLIPEYYSQSCLSCHGGPAGEMDITGFPKEGGEEGALGGAISITLAQ